MASVWITGARGFIGRHLARYLHRCGYEVVGLGHGTWPPESVSRWGLANWLNGEVNGTNLQRLLQENGPPDMIYHLAGGSLVGSSYRSPAEDFHRTVYSTVSLLEWARQYARKATIICSSSAAVYGDGHEGPISETFPGTPFSPYGFHKAIMEKLCESYVANFNLKIAVARLFSVYGPYLEKQLIWDVCSKLSKGLETIVLGGSGEELRDWLYISDAVRLLGILGEKCGSKLLTVNGGTGSGTRVSLMASLICEYWDKDVNISFSGSRRPGDPRSLIADTAYAGKLGFEPQVTLGVGIESTVKWCRERLDG